MQMCLHQLSLTIQRPCLILLFFISILKMNVQNLYLNLLYNIVNISLYFVLKLVVVSLIFFFFFFFF